MLGLNRPAIVASTLSRGGHIADLVRPRRVSRLALLAVWRIEFPELSPDAPPGLDGAVTVEVTAAGGGSVSSAD